MTLKTVLEVSPKLVWAKFILMMVVLVIRSGMSMDFEETHENNDITPGNDKPTLTAYEGGTKHSYHSFFFEKTNKFYRFPLKLTRKHQQGTSTSKTSSKLVIPNEGGIVRITRPKNPHKRVRRLSENTTVVGDKVSTKVNSNSINIPDGGGHVHIDFPDYVKYGLGKMKSPEDGLTTIKARNKDSGNLPVQIPGEDNAVPGSGDSIVSVGSENVTQVVSEETSAITSQQPVTSIYIGSSDYPFFAAVHGNRGSGDISFDDVQCSGGIVSETAVVTSCNCLYGDDWPVPLSFVFYFVSVGHQRFANINDTPVYHVESVRYHPSCEKTATGLWQGNIAMLTIPKPGIEFDKNVQPMNLPKLKMWDASDVLAKMSDQRRHCRVIGWSRRAPLIDTALGKLIPLDECANPVCKKNLPCPRRTTVDGFMVEITANEPSLLPGALLYCSNHVFAIVNTKRQCPTNNVFAACSPEELIYSKFGFELTPEAQRDMLNYNNTFLKSIEGWETFTYPPTVELTTTPAAKPNSTRQEMFAKFVSSGTILFPFYVSREASWIYTYVFATGYYLLFRI